MTTTALTADDTDARSQLMGHLTAKWATPVIAVLARLGVADHVVDGARSADELAAAVGADPRSLYRVLRAAASIGVFAQDDQGRFGATSMSDCLRTDVPGTLRSAAMMFGLAPFWDPYSQVLHSVTTGQPAFDRVFGATIYEYLQAHPDDAAIFGGAAASFHAQATEAIAAAHDFGRYDVVVDVGGGTGSLLAAILLANPTVRGVLFELDGVLNAAREQLVGTGIEHRVELVAGDFFTAVPPGDALLIKSCLHNFSDDDAVRVLRVLRAAIPANGRLLVAETVVPTGNEPHYAKFDDIEMLVIAGGVDRSAEEYRELLAAGGFRTVALTPCDDRFSLLEAVPN